MVNEGSLEEGLTAQEESERTAYFVEQFKPGRLRPKTNNGVTLGMTPEQVKGLLGRPKRAFHSKRFDAYELIYKRQDDRQYSNYYLFRDNKLFYIELASDSLDGG